MSKRFPSGFISTFYDPLKNPDAPTIGTATAGDTTASVPFTAPANVGGSAITEYNARSTPGDITASAASSPISVTGLTNDTAYTFAVWAINTYGTGPFSASSNSVTPAGPRGLFAGGQNEAVAKINVIGYVTIGTLGNAADFGDLTDGRFGVSAASSSTRGVFISGNGIAANNVMDYVTFSTAGNATDFGDTIANVIRGAGCSNSTRGLTGGDEAPTIQYFTIASLGDTVSFGSLSVGPTTQLGACASTTRGIWAGGLRNGSTGNVIDYVTIATTGNAVDFGDLADNTRALAGCSSATRGVFAGGGAFASGASIVYITMASTGNSTTFGNLLSSTGYQGACSNSTRGLWGGGSTYTNVLQYVTISTTGNATDFGDLTIVTESSAACSNGHGGI